MKKNIFLPVLFAMAAVFPVFADGSQQTGEAAVKTRVFRLAESQSNAYPTVAGEQAFAGYVTAKTNGMIKITVNSSGILGDEWNTLEQTQTGDIQLIRLGLDTLSMMNPVINSLAMPYLFRDRAQMYQILDGPIGKDLMESLQKQNLLGLCWMDGGFRNFYNARKEAASPNDIKGLRIRAEEGTLLAELVRFLGANPVPMAYGDVSSGIRSGTIDGAEGSWFSFIASSNFEAAKFITLDGHTASPEMILINTSVWDSLTDEEKTIFKDGALEGARAGREAWLRAEQEYEKQARSSGCTITVLTPAQYNLFVEAAAPVYRQPAYAQYSRMINRIRDSL